MNICFYIQAIFFLHLYFQQAEKTMIKDNATKNEPAKSGKSR